MEGHITHWAAKAPLARGLRKLNLSNWKSVSPADPLAQAQVLTVLPPGLAVESPSVAGDPVVALFASGGTHGTTYAIAIRVTTQANRVDEFVGLLPVVDPLIEVSGDIGAGTAAAPAIAPVTGGGLPTGLLVTNGQPPATVGVLGDLALDITSSPGTLVIWQLQAGEWAQLTLVQYQGGGLSQDGMALMLTTTTGWLTSNAGLSPGDLWANGNFVNAVPGTSPDPEAAPVFFGSITAAELLLLGGKNLPLSDPHVVNQLWLNGVLVCISLG